MRVNKFGSLIKNGTNNKSLEKLKSYYSKFEGVGVSRYEFISDSDRWAELSEIIPSTDLHRCRICGNKLYEYTVEDGQNLVRSTRMTISHLTSGEEAYSCYGINSCTKRGSKINSPVSIISMDLHPTFDSFVDSLGCGPILRVPVGVDDEQASILKERAAENYNSIIVPFLKTWINTEINKSNVQLFMDDYYVCCRSHLKFYEPKVEREVKKKLLKTIGVTID